MLTINRTRATLADGGTVYGLICSIPSPTLVEMIGCAGYDFVVMIEDAEDHHAWVGRGVRAFVLGEERGLAARALRSHLGSHRGES